MNIVVLNRSDWLDERKVRLVDRRADHIRSVLRAAVGDSITAGVHSSGGNHTYPAQLQLLLDQGQGEGTYAVTNLGACGSMLLRNSSSPYWARPQYTALLAGKWDIVVIMLGTNDAHNDCGAPASRPGCSSNWSKDCGGVLGNASLDDCRFAADFAALVAVVSRDMAEIQPRYSRDIAAYATLRRSHAALSDAGEDARHNAGGPAGEFVMINFR